MRIDHLRDSTHHQKTDNMLIARAQSLLYTRLANHPNFQERAVEAYDILSGWVMPTRALIAAFLLPILRLELLPENELVSVFGSRPTALARAALRLSLGETAPDTRRRPNLRAMQAEKRRRMFLSAFTDVDTVLLCLADHLAAAAQLNGVSEELRQAWVQENSAIYLPVTEMLGMWSYRHVLADLGLSLIDHALYEKYEGKVAAYFQRHEALFNAIAPELSHLLALNGVTNCDIAQHEITPASLHRSNQDSAAADSTAIMRVDVLVQHEHDVYQALRVIHNRWLPANRWPSTHRLSIPNSPPPEEWFIDTIAVPSFNGYRSLTTTVLADGPRAAPRLIEFRIHTFTMQAVNLRGVITARLDPIAIQHAWWNDTTAADLLAARETSPLSGEVCVLTGIGEPIYPLRRGATIIDYLFKVNPATAPYARVFWVNGVQVNADYELRNRDMVEIDYDYRYPALKPDWEDAAHTATARASIRRFWRARERSPERGKALIEAALQRESAFYRMRYPPQKLDAGLHKLLKNYHCHSVEQLCVRVADDDLRAEEIAAALIEDELVGHIVQMNGDAWPGDKVRLARTWTEGLQADAAELRLIPGMEIVGQVIDKNALLVFRKDSPFAPPPEKAVPLRWRAQKIRRESAEITITAPPRSAAAAPVWALLNRPMPSHGKEASEIIVHRFHLELQEASVAISILLDAPSQEAIQQVQQGLEGLQQAGTITEFTVWQMFPGQKSLIAGKSDKRRQNPYSLRQVRDSSMFFGRGVEIDRVIQWISEGETFIVLYGPKRIGKTSLMVQLAEKRLPEQCDALPILFDAHSLSPFDPQSFLLALAEATVRKLEMYLKRADQRRGLRLRARDLQNDPYRAFAQWVARAQKQLGGKRLLFMIDEFTRAEEEVNNGKLDASFFDGLQWLAGNQGIGFLLCVHDNIYRSTSRSWGMLQRAHPIRLGTLDQVAAARLVRQPLERLYQISDDMVDHILDITHCHPFFINAICLELVAHLSTQTDERVTEADLGAAISVVLQTGSHYFSHYQSRVDDFTWTVLKTLAHLSTGAHHWVNSDAIRAELEGYGGLMHRWQVSESIGDLYHSGIIDARNTSGKAAYRISVKLLQFWLHDKSTHPLIARDLQRKD